MRKSAVIGVAAILALHVPSLASAQAVWVGGGPTFPVDHYGEYAKTGGMVVGGVSLPMGRENLSLFGEAYYGGNGYFDINGDAGVTVYPGGKEIYSWAVEQRDGEVTVAIYVTKERNGSWTSPEVASFSGTYQDMYPALHPDGSRLYYQSNRPIDPSETTHEYNIWYVDREGDGWSEPSSMGRPINGRSNTGGAAVTLDGTMYFTIMDLDGEGQSELFRSVLVNGVYQEPERLPDAVNARYQTTDSYIAPDESYLIFTAFETVGHTDNPGTVYIAFRDQDGRWGEGVEMGPEINSEDQFGSVTISPDGQYLFFTAYNHADSMGLDVYWVDSEVVDSLRETG